MPDEKIDAFSTRDACHARYAEHRETKRVVALDDVPGGPHYMLTRYEDCRDALADPRLSRDPALAIDMLRAMGVYGADEAPDSEPHMLNADPPEHTRLRRIVAKAFTPRRVESLRPRIQQIADDLIDDFCEDGAVDLVSKFNFPLPIMVISELLGVPHQDRESFRFWSTSALAPKGTEGTMPTYEANEKLRSYFTSLLDERRAELATPQVAQGTEGDLITALIQATDSGQTLTDKEIVSTLALLLVAGHETTANLLGNALLALLSNPRQHALLVQQPNLIQSATEEFLRYDGPLESSMIRVATSPLTVGDTTIPKGAVVVIGLASANRDPRRFTDPAELNIERTSNRHLTFGHGIHFCLGAGLSRLESEIAMTTLLSRLHEIILQDSSRAIPYRPTGVLRGLEILPIAFTPTTRIRSTQ